MIAEKLALAIKIKDCDLVVRRERIDNKRSIAGIRTILRV